MEHIFTPWVTWPSALMASEHVQNFIRFAPARRGLRLSPDWYINWGFATNTQISFFQFSCLKLKKKILEAPVGRGWLLNVCYATPNFAIFQGKVSQREFEMRFCVLTYFFICLILNLTLRGSSFWYTPDYFWANDRICQWSFENLTATSIFVFKSSPKLVYYNFFTLKFLCALYS